MPNRIDKEISHIYSLPWEDAPTPVVNAILSVLDSLNTELRSALERIDVLESRPTCSHGEDQ